MSDEGMTREALLREVVVLRKRVAELQRAAARHDDTAGISLAEREELLYEAERVAHLGTWTWDIGSGRVTWSDELYRILGLNPAEVLPSVETFFAAVHPEDRERAQQAAEKSLRDGVLPLVDCRIVQPDGSIRHTTSSSSILFDNAGAPRRLVGGVLDRTESLAIEGKLRRTLGLLEEAQRFAQLGSWRFDPASGELEWSREFCRIAGLPPDVTPDLQLFQERVAPEDRERLRLAHERSMQKMQDWEMDVRLNRPDGHVRLVRLKAFSVLGADQRRELRGTMLDVTDQVRMREEMVHAQKMEAVGRLAGGIAHDFNNVLTVIGASCELLAERIGPAPEIDNSLQALNSAASLTRRLLAFGRRAQLALKVMEPNELVRSTMALMHRLVGDEVRLEIDLAHDLPSVRVDPVEIERALVNLVINAKDAMPGGGVVRIGTRDRVVNESRQVELFVADNGPGIDESVRPHVFEPFFTTRGQSGGNGLGLATVLGTAEQHGGTVRLEAREGGGTVFTIVLPVVQGPTDPVTRMRGADESAGVARTLHLLVIDDEPSVANVTRRILERRAHVVRVATGLEEALEVWRHHGSTLDLVICDVALGSIRGQELIKRFSLTGKLPRVLFMTGYSQEAVHAELGYPVLAKPFTAADLFRAINDAVA